MLMAEDAVAGLRSRPRARRSSRLAGRWPTGTADTPMVARTLTQHAVPTTFGLKVAAWLTGGAGRVRRPRRLAFPVQLGGAAGTRRRSSSSRRPDDVARRAGRAARAGTRALAHAAPGHPARRRAGRLHRRLRPGSPTTSSRCRRPEIGELAEGSGGGSSTMPAQGQPGAVGAGPSGRPHARPQLAATLHLAAAEQVDERPTAPGTPSGRPCATWSRRTVVAASPDRRPARRAAGATPTGWPPRSAAATP